MALIVPSGGLVSQVNGKVDGKVYYRGRWGNVVRAWVNPTNTITPQRTAIRALFTSLMSLFNSLTPEMQDEWNQYAVYMVKFNRLAQPYVPTGLQVFLERNINLSIVGIMPLLLPPPDDELFYLKSFFAVSFTTAHLQVDGIYSNGLTTIPGNNVLAYYATNNTPPGRMSATNRYRFINVQPPGFTVAINNLIAWNGAWNPSTLIVGQKIFMKAITINQITGKASPPAYCSQIIS